LGKELINWENGRWIGQTLEVENGVCAVPGKDLSGMPKGLMRRSSTPSTR